MWVRVILPEVALLGKIQSRCDGVGSEVNGGKPSVKRGPAGYPPGVLPLMASFTLVRFPSGGFEYRNREVGRTAFARPAELVLSRESGATPRLRTERFSPDW